MAGKYVEFKLRDKVLLGELLDESSVGFAYGIDQQIAALNGQNIAQSFRFGKSID